MWTSENRTRYERDKLRYPSDLTDEEWSLIEPLIPPAKHGGRHRKVDPREIVNGLMYVLSTGCQWRYVPKDLPPHAARLSRPVELGRNAGEDAPRALYEVPRTDGPGSQSDSLRDRQPEH